MQTLIFNTTEKTIEVNEGGILLYNLENITTVKPLDGYYEVMQRVDSDTAPSGYSAIPVLRLPICATNMLIIK
jgi:hypothetical protein